MWLKSIRLKALLEADANDYIVSGLHELIPRWQNVVERHYHRLSIERNALESDLKAAIAEFKKANDDLILYKDSDQAKAVQRHLQLQRANPYHRNNRRRPSTASQGQPRALEVEVDDPNWTPPLFSSFSDKKGYNGRTLSKYKIDCVVSTAVQPPQSLHG